MTRDNEPGSRPASRSLRVEAFAELLRRRRLDVGLSQRAVAAAAGVSFMTVARAEAGDTPALSTFLALCAWMKLSPATFLTVTPSSVGTVTAVERALTADPRLSVDAVQTITATVSAMHQTALRARPAGSMVTHLAPFCQPRPGMQPRLATVLAAMGDALTADIAAQSRTPTGVVVSPVPVSAGTMHEHDPQSDPSNSDGCDSIRCRNARSDTGRVLPRARSRSTA